MRLEEVLTRNYCADGLIHAEAFAKMFHNMSMRFMCIILQAVSNPAKMFQHIFCKRSIDVVTRKNKTFAKEF